MAKPEKIVEINTQQNPSAALDRIMRGVDLLADAVKQTLGKYGRNFMLEKHGGKITNDGLKIANEIQAKDEIEDLGLRIAREGIRKTNEEAGDGTTTATTLLQAIIRECMRYMAKGTTFAKRSVLSLKQQLEKECEEVIGKLKEMAKPVESKEDLIAVARVSVEDEELAQLIGDAQWELGPNGIIIPEETTETTCSIERIAGIRIDNGLGTSMVMNDIEKQRLVVEDVYVLLTNHTLSSLSPIKPALDQLIREKNVREFVIVARAFSSECIREIMQNEKSGLHFYPMNAPYVNQREVFKDLESVLGGRYIHDEMDTLENITPLDFGKAKKVIGYRYSAIFTGEKDVSGRVKELEKEHEGEPSKFNKRALEERVAQLKNGFALLKVGSESDVDRKYKFDKVEDAVNAVRSALQEGTVPGAGLAMKEIAEGMPEDSLLKRPLMKPYLQIMENAGETFEVEPWVRNSLKVERVALANACKVAATIITTGGAVAAEKIKPVDQLLAQKAQGMNPEE